MYHSAKDVAEEGVAYLMPRPAKRLLKRAT